MEMENEFLQLKAKVEALEKDMLMPKFFYHSPLNYDMETPAPVYDPSIEVEGEPFPLPPPQCRPGYAPDDDERYLEWGQSDYNFIKEIINKHYEEKEGLTILDWGCSSGRVLRHFYQDHQEQQWNLIGTELQAYLVEWMRNNFPEDINIFCGSTFPHLPFEDSSIDVIYGISVFTHTKYLWDFWLTEFKRVLKPGGLCMQTVQCEHAWKFYYQYKDLDWVKNGHPESMLKKPEMDEDFFFYGDGFISQTFYKEEYIKKHWNRYMKVVDFLAPPKFSYQNWIVLKNV